MDNKYFYVNKEFSKDLNILPNEYENQIICGDSLNVLKNFPDNCIDTIIMSPPYNFSIEYNKYNDNVDYNKYFNTINNILLQCIRVLKYSGRLIIVIQPQYRDYIPTHHIISNFLMNNDMIWKGEILWNKNNYNCPVTAWGSWKSPSSPYLKYTCEFIEIFCKGDIKKQGNSNDIDITGDEFKKWTTANWNITTERNMSKFNHPAMFPEELVERLLKLFTFQNDIILDPFNGVGTTTFIANKLNRKYVGIDISKEYCDTAIKRIKGEI